MSFDVIQISSNTTRSSSSAAIHASGKLYHSRNVQPIVAEEADIVHALAREIQIVCTMDGAADDLVIERAVAAKALADEVRPQQPMAEVEQGQILLPVLRSYAEHRARREAT